MEERSPALISWAVLVLVLGFGVFTCYRSYFFIIPDFPSGLSQVERNLVQWSNWAFSVFIILRCWPPWNFNTTSREQIPVATNLHECTKGFPPYSVLEDLMHRHYREMQGFPPEVTAWMKGESLCLSLCTSGQTCSPETHGNQQQRSWVSDVGLPLLPPRSWEQLLG